MRNEAQIVAARVNYGGSFTVSSVYFSNTHNFNSDIVTDIITQLPQPFLLLGDFNANNTLWGCKDTIPRGRIMDKIVADYQLNILNNWAPTRIYGSSESAIDLSICSQTLQANTNWTTFETPRDSDHCPILLTLNACARERGVKYRSLRKMDWAKYQGSKVWKHISQLADESVSPADMVEDFYSRMTTAVAESVPEEIKKPYYPKPWWSAELTDSLSKREKAYKTYKRRRSPQNFIKWKRARAEHRMKVKEHKTKTWRDMCNKMNVNTSRKKVWESIAKIKGKTAKKISILEDKGVRYTTIPAICNKLATTFEKISKTENYSTAFQKIKEKEESKNLNFLTNKEEDYNKEMSERELEAALQQAKDTTPGPDEITYEMLRKLPDNGKAYLLKIYNAIYRTEYFPELWRKSIIVPIQKPGKSASSPFNYRPIALTSTVCKTMERIVNVRLQDYLERRENFGKIQTGGMKGRSAIDQLVGLETAIRSGFANEEHVISLFFDLEKAYDLTWKRGIMRDLHAQGLRGRLPRFVERFLTDRTFRVRINGIVSDEKVQENGIPQGSILSVTLFIVKIDAIARLIPSEVRFHSSLYMDDLQVSYRHSDIRVIQARLQNLLHDIADWTESNGFRFSPAKTKMMHFSNREHAILPPSLYINQNQIESVNEVKFLGVYFDSKLNWKAHVEKVRENC